MRRFPDTAQDVCDRIIPVFGACFFASFGIANQPVVLHREYTALYLYHIHFQTEVDRYQHGSRHLSPSALCKHTALWIGNDDHTQLSNNNNNNNN